MIKLEQQNVNTNAQSLAYDNPQLMENNMDNFTAIGIAEGFIEAETEEQVIEAWQHLIDTGLAWSLQGFFGRTAQTLIEEGYCTTPSKGE